MVNLRAFEKPLEVSDEDHLSKLPEDCVREVFKHITQDDLQVLTTVSQRMFYFCENFASAVPRSAAVELKVFKTIDGERYVDLVRKAPLVSTCFMHETSGVKRTIEYVECKPYNNWMLDLKTSNADLSFIIKQAAFLMRRYTFDVVIFNSVLIDENFISAFERVWLEKCMRELNFHNSSLVDPKGAGVAKRLLGQLLSVKPSVLRLDARGIIKEIDEIFLREYARATQSPQLYARSTTKKPFSVGDSFCDTLSSFDSLLVDRLQVGAEWIVKAILNRLRRKKYGTIACAISRIVYRNEIIEQVEPDIKYINVEGRYVLQLKGTDHHADIKTTEGKPCRLFVTFTRRVEPRAAERIAS